VPKTWQQSLALGLAFLVAVSVLFIFGYRAARHARYLRSEDQPIHAWMSVPFVAHTHHVATEILYAAIGIAPREHDRRPLRAIARQQHRPVDEVIRDLEKAIAKERGKAP
jgi:hypothetical protein